MWKKCKSIITSVALGFLLAVGLVPAARAATIKPEEVLPAAYRDKLPSEVGSTGSRIVTIVIVVGAVLTLGYMLWGAIDMITAEGDTGKVEAARDKIMYSIIGLIVLASSWAIYQLVLFVTFGGSNISVPTLR